MNEIEIQLRKNLAITHHVIHHFGWDDLLATHVSARIPNTDMVLITPHNKLFNQVNHANIVKLNLAGQILSNNNEKVMPQAANIHLEVYKAKSEINAIIHTHSKYGVILSSLSQGLMYLNQQSLRFYNDVAYHKYDGLALENEGMHIASSLKNKKVMILKNHGLITTGKSLEESLYLHYYLEQTAELQVLTLSASKEVKEIDEAICIKTKKQFDSVMSPHLEFEAFKAITKHYDL